MTIEPTTIVTSGVAAIATTFAVIDPSITSIVLAIIAAAVVIIPLWFKFKTDAMNAKLKEQDAKIEEVKNTSDGMKDALVKATAESNRSEGQAEGRAQAEAVADKKIVDVAEGAAAEKKNQLL